LATDFNPGTCNCENLQLIISFACQELRLTPAEALYATTMGGATALGLQREVGSIEVGKRCDVLVLDAASHEELPYHYGVNLEDSVVAGGALAVAGGALVHDHTLGGRAAAGPGAHINPRA
jgi:imidazolonepropionase